MSPLLFLAVSLAGGLGACARFILDGLIRAKANHPTPWGTIIINISGSFLLGYLTGVASQSLLPPTWLPIVGTGFLGGYTTFSTASVETARLLTEERRLAATVSGVGTLLGATAAAAAGLWLA